MFFNICFLKQMQRTFQIFQISWHMQVNENPDLLKEIMLHIWESFHINVFIVHFEIII